MLGVGVLPVRLTLSFELLVLNVACVLVGLAAIYVVTEAVSPAMGIAAASYFAGSVIAAIVGSAVVTKAGPLELLQVKE